MRTTELSAFALPDAVRQAQGFDAAESAGLFVGVRTFADPRIVEVPYAVDDAIDLARLFALELGLVAPERTVLALAGEPQKASSLAALEALCAAGAEVRPATLAAVYRDAWELGQASGARGLFVVSIASHGFADQGAAVLAAADTLLRRRVHTGLSVDALLDDVTQSEAPRRLVLVDACRERFSARSRTGETDPASVLGEAFREAIGRVRGLAMLAGTTYGGYAYDDPRRQNGVFTSALCDGLRGKAPADERHYVTLESLTAYVDERVRRWVKRHRPDHRELSRGVAATFDPDEVRRLPLALDAPGLAAAEEVRRRRNAALERLRRELDPPLTGAIFDEIRRFLEPDLPTPVTRELLEEIEALDGSVRMRRALAHFVSERREELRGTRQPLAPPAVRPESSSARPRPVATAAAPHAEHHLGGVWEEPGLGLRFRYVPPGSFRMGSPADEPQREDAETLHEVTLSRGLWVAETAVTQGQWRALMETEPSRFRGDESLPVETVSWYEAVAFANALSESGSRDLLRARQR